MARRMDSQDIPDIRRRLDAFFLERWHVVQARQAPGADHGQMQYAAIASSSRLRTGLAHLLNFDGYACR